MLFIFDLLFVIIEGKKKLFEWLSNDFLFEGFIEIKLFEIVYLVLIECLKYEWYIKLIVFCVCI